jgi:hypothetical protein
VAVPRPRPAAVELRRVDVDVPLKPGPRLLVGEDVAAFPQKDLVEQRLDLSDAHGFALAHLLESPPRRRLRHEGTRLRVDERGADVAEVEGVPDARADPAQDLGVRGLARDLRRHREQRLESALVPVRLSGLACRLDCERRVVGERDEDVELLVGGPTAADRLVHGDDSEQQATLVAHRDEECVLGIPRVGMARARSLRNVARPERAPVDRSARDVVGAAPLEAVGEEHRPVLAGTRIAEQRRPSLRVPVHGRDLEVVPLRPIEVDRDGPVAERLADGSGDSVEQRRKILTRPQKTGYLDEAPQR